MTQALFLAALGTGFTCLMTALGACVVFLFRRQSSPGLHRVMLGFAAGVMLAASVWSLLIPSIEKARELHLAGWLPAAGGSALGIAFLLAMDALLPHLAPESFHWREGQTSRRRTLMLVLAVTLHNIPEGMAVGVSFALAAQAEDPALLTAAVALALVVIAGALLGPAAQATDFAAKNLAPSWAHPFGTDWMGRDMLARTLAGLSTSVLVGLLAATVSSVIALILGCAAALGGKRVDAVVSWMIDLMMGVPHIVLLVLISFALGKGFWGVTIGVAVTHWASLARVVRAEVLQCRQSKFVEVARKLGQSPARIALRHMVPYVLPQFVVGLILLFPHAILHEASITFLGFGLPPEQPAIGVILSESMSYLSTGAWWLAVFPGLALMATVLLFDVAGQNLRKLVDPHTAQK